MKQFNLIFLYTLLLMSCDPYEVIQEPEVSLNKDTSILMRGAELPFNSSNAYDFAGQVHSDIFNSYYDLPSIPSSLDSIISLIDAEMSHHDYFEALPNFDYDRFSTAYYDSIIKQPTLSLDNALATSLLTTPARDTLQTFLNALFLKINSEEDYEAIYDFIITYESSIVNTSNYNYAEKEFLLTVTSITRHSIYYKDKKKPKPKPNTDPDWDWLITCIVGAVDGAVYSVPESVATSLKTGIGAE